MVLGAQHNFANAFSNINSEKYVDYSNVARNLWYEENFKHVHTSRQILIYVRNMGESVTQYKKNS
jgi:hypothetical protein